MCRLSNLNKVAHESHYAEYVLKVQNISGNLENVIIKFVHLSRTNFGSGTFTRTKKKEEHFFNIVLATRNNYAMELMPPMAVYVAVKI